MFFPTTEILFFNPLFSKEKRIYMFYYKTFSARMLHLSFLFRQNKNVNIKIDIFSCFYRFAILHNTQPVLLCIFTFRQRSTKAATAASLSRSLYPLLCKLLYLFLE